MKTIKTLALTLTLAVFLGAATAHAGKEGWLTDYEAAVKKAKEENRIVLVDFQGSDWCPPCIKLSKDVFSTDAFKALADESLVLLNVDFPRKTELPEAQQEHNNALAQKFGIQYFPTVLLVSPEGEVLNKMVGFPRDGLEGFLSFVKSELPSKS